MEPVVPPLVVGELTAFGALVRHSDRREVAELLVPEIDQEQQVFLVGDTDVEQGDLVLDAGRMRGGRVVFTAGPRLADPQRVPVGRGDDLEVRAVAVMLPPPEQVDALGGVGTRVIPHRVPHSKNEKVTNS